MKRVAGLLAALLVLAGCSTGTDAVARGGTFEFVTPGGKTEIFYDPPAERGTVGQLSGPAVRDRSRTVSLAQFRGQVVVLNVWGSWCGPCRAEAGDLQQVAEQTAGDATVLGIDVRDRRSAAADFMRNYGLTYPSIFDPPGRTLFALRDVPRSIVPLTVVLDRQHRVAAVFLREITAEDLLPVVSRLAAEPR
ncbi:MAG: redoxin domain-containing protein [Pseudonocardiaceae bacterium]|nr:redoxin domain-containing protein [Pseudonocardiaceae bacterium]